MPAYLRYHAKPALCSRHNLIYSSGLRGPTNLVRRKPNLRCEPDLGIPGPSLLPSSSQHAKPGKPTLTHLLTSLTLTR